MGVYDVVICGGGVGGCAAALACAAQGKRVLLTEETDWLGGQLTAQAVPPDENPWIETFGGTRRYRAFREGVRHYYRDRYPLTPAARADPLLNPGLVMFRGCVMSLVSRWRSSKRSWLHTFQQD